MVLSLNRIRRINQRIKPFYESVNTDRMNALEKEFKDIMQTNTIVIVSLILFYMLLYISILTSVFGDFWLLTYVQQITSIIGSTVLIIFITFLHWYTGILVSDSHTISSEIIAIGEKKKK